MKLDQMGVSQLSKSQKIVVNFKTMRDTAKIRLPRKQLFALSIFEPNRPLKWPFGLFLKHCMPDVSLIALVLEETVKAKVCHEVSPHNFYYCHFTGKCTGKNFQILKWSVRSSSSSYLCYIICHL